MHNPLSTAVRSKRHMPFIALFLIISMVIPPLLPAMSVKASEPVIDESFFMDTAVGKQASSTSDNGLQLLLSDGQQQAQSVEENPVAVSTPLSAEETQVILDRLPALPSNEQVQTDFRLPPQSPPPPKTGAVIEEPFPPTEDGGAPVMVESGPLEVLRYSPEGEIPIAPFLNVTFNQPMVPLATIEDLSAQDVPVKLTPELPGTWRWIGTQTLSFEFSDENGERFPMATEYVAEVPAGTESALGNALAETVRWTFTTPPPTVVRAYPSNGPQQRDPILFVAFNQTVDPNAVLERVSVTAGGNSYPVRAATDEEISGDKTIARLVEDAGEERWIAFRAVELFPSNTTVVVNIGPNTPSAEGPLVTKEVQSFGFQTYPPLRIDNHRCGYNPDATQCTPLSPLEITFNNPLDEEAFSEEMISVTPDIAGQIIEVFDRTIRIRGQTAGRTTYTVTIDGSISDTFGQTLGEKRGTDFQDRFCPICSGRTNQQTDHR